MLLFFFCCYYLITNTHEDSELAGSCSQPTICTNNLTNPIYTDAQILVDTVIYADTAYRPNFHDVKYFSGDCKGVNRPPDSTICEDDTSVLKYYVFYPDTLLFNYKNCRLPAMVFFHGGGFQDCGGSLDDSLVVKICREFARRGFICYDVEYRRGAQIKNSNVYSAQQILAIYRAAQDGRGAIRSIVRHQELRNTPYSFDTTKLFIGGQSAGSVVAMSVAYFSKQSMFDSVYPGVSNAKILGSINQGFYYGTSAVKYKIRGFMNLWGGLAIPLSYVNNPDSFFRQNDTIPPMITFHGIKDPVFNYRRKNVVFLPDALDPDGTNYGKEGHCLLNDTAHYILYHKGSVTSADSYLLGGQSIHEMLKRLGKATELYLDCQAGHGLDTTSTASLYTSNYGTASTNSTTTSIYIVQRACIFFQAVINSNTAFLRTTKFVECENYRFGCDTASYNDSCPYNIDSAKQICKQQP